MVMTRRPLVLARSGRLRWEMGPVREPDYRSERIAVVAHWSDRPQVSRSVHELAAQLVDNGYDVIVSSAAECPQELIWPDLPDGVSVYRRDNIGYDFGSWAHALATWPGIRDTGTTIMVNDSLVGPFAPLRPVLDRLDGDDHPVWGLVSTTQDTAHLQSHFMAYRDGILNHPKLRRFWSGVRVEPTKRDLILRYEIGLGRLLRRSGIGYGAGFDWERVVPPGANPTSQGWRRLMLMGFPFVKRELVLRPPDEVADVGDVPGVVRDLYGVDVMEWV